MLDLTSRDIYRTVQRIALYAEITLRKRTPKRNLRKYTDPPRRNRRHRRPIPHT